MKQLLFLVFVSFLFVSCKKEQANRPATEQTPVVFYSTGTTTILNSYIISVNGRVAGRLKYNPVQPSCADTGFVQVRLSKGNHYVDVPSTNGNAGKTVYFVVDGTECQTMNIIP